MPTWTRACATNDIDLDDLIRAVVILASPKTVAHSLKLEVGGDDDAGPLVELAQKMEQQRAA